MRVALVPRSAEIKPLFWRFVPYSSSFLRKAEWGTFDLEYFKPSGGLLTWETFVNKAEWGRSKFPQYSTRVPLSLEWSSISIKRFLGRQPKWGSPPPPSGGGSKSSFAAFFFLFLPISHPDLTNFSGDIKLVVRWKIYGFNTTLFPGGPPPQY